MAKEKATFSQQASNILETVVSSVRVFLTKSVLLLSASKPQNHNKNIEQSDMQPAQRLLSCLFCLLSGRRESRREGERERQRAADPTHKNTDFLFQHIEKTNKELLCWGKTRGKSLAVKKGACWFSR